MNGIHDVGGMDGFGPVPYDGGESDTFHERWEGEAYATFVATLGNRVASIDEFRHSIERLPPEQYLESTYYDRWVTALTRLLLEDDVIDPGTFASRTDAFEAGTATVPDYEDPRMLGRLAAGVEDSYATDAPAESPLFAVGDAVVVRNRHPDGHTRCPRYARRARGEVVARRGTQVLPDARAHGDDGAEPLYQVAFDGTELWGEDAEDGVSVTLDLWESYLKPAEADAEGSR
ncbi:nitrile hydratase subunit beta [Natronococcus sp.]|uniref:nitrile hydratase subunit beta n=1 Tax=Natronococcus sp. TaxID=35747 RepID=UPI003A4E210C